MKTKKRTSISRYSNLKTSVVNESSFDVGMPTMGDHLNEMRIGVIKKYAKPGADRITQEDIDVAMEEYRRKNG